MYTEKMRASHGKNHMHRRDYELIAEIISRGPQRNVVARHFAEELAKSCPGFLPSRFLAACGVVP